MNIVVHSSFTQYENANFAEIVSKYAYDEERKSIKIINILFTLVCIPAICFNLFAELYGVAVIVGLAYAVCLLLSRRFLSTSIPKSIAKLNLVECPSKMTFGFYDEYYYKKKENDMVVSEDSIRYEYLTKVVETPDFFVVLDKRRCGCIVPKRDMEHGDIMILSSFFSSKCINIYRYASK